MKALLMMICITLSSCGTMRMATEPPRYYALTPEQKELAIKESKKKGTNKVIVLSLVSVGVVALIIDSENDNRNY